ncbi:HPP family protein [Psychrobacter pygoscelis]|uniref:HPP family protein n=1 Tax=Psychrobacter pygoscelis TaxID=2488563 RepID=UPI001F603139|nr:HPP family protein [Psychrobacter pygoscelis]
MIGGASWQFLLTPTLLGSIVLVMVALIYNNLGSDVINSNEDEKRHYPTYWW